MSDGIKRFYKEAAAQKVAGGFGLTLDGRTYKTPAESAFVLPTQAMAQAVAAEWNAAGDKIFPDQMPITTHANTAIDRVIPQRADVVKELVGYAGTELLCYRAADPAALVDRQKAEWDPLLAWACDAKGLTFKLAEGILHVAQPEQTLAQATALLTAMSDFELAALFTLITVTG
ncbi:MAG: ATP12 family protein, partial [Alphaproteobacteria bacterium]